GASRLDPLGAAAFEHATKYWTVSEKNTSILPITGILLWNRLLWTGVAAAILTATVWRFQFAVAGRRRWRRKRALGNGQGNGLSAAERARLIAEGESAARALPSAAAPSALLHFRQYLKRSWLETIGVVRGA